MFESETTVHGVGRELKSLLLDVVLKVPGGIQRVILHERFDLFTPVHERSDETRENAQRDIFAGWLGDLLFALLSSN